MQRAVVLDTSAVLSGKASSVPAYAPESILTEFQRPGRDRRSLDFLLETGLRLVPPTAASLRRVEEAATDTGDSRRLSPVDIDVLAVALDVNGTIHTDDYSIQNVASVLHIPFTGVSQAGITEVITWVYRCRGCGKIWPENPPKECTVCGSEIRQVKARPGQKPAR